MASSKSQLSMASRTASGAPSGAASSKELVVPGARLGALLELQRIGRDAVVGQQVLGEVELVEVGGEGRVALASRHEAALVDGVQPLAEVDARRGCGDRLAAADVLRLAVQERAEDLAPLLLAHALGDGADDAAGGGLLVRDDLVDGLGIGGGAHHLPVGQVQPGLASGRGGAGLRRPWPWPSIRPCPRAARAR